MCGAWVRARRAHSVAGISAITTAGLLLAGCGGRDAPPRPAVCELAAQNAIATDLGVSAASLTYQRAVGRNGMPQCSFTVRARGRRITVTANVDDGPQPYFRLLRTVNEATQIFGPPPPGFHAPQGVSGLGPFASWFPDNHWLMATNDKVLVTLTVTWPGASRDQEVTLARAAIKPYVPHIKGHRNTKDFP